MAASNQSHYSPDMYEYERAFQVQPRISWMSSNWTLAVWLSAIYIAIIFSGRSYMSTRPRFDLQLPLAIWSSALAAFSIAGSIRTIPELHHTLTLKSFQDSVCNPSFLVEAPSAFWGYYMTMSKALELGDTVFIVLRKQPLIFLHWYHHATVLMYGFYTYGQQVAMGRWFCVMNYVVHAFMYSYYALKAMRVWIPRTVSMVITSLQLCQMAVGILVNVMAYHYLKQGQRCSVTYDNLFWAFLMYLSYLILFAHFFYKTYIATKPAPS